jgi:hypothetical protein
MHGEETHVDLVLGQIPVQVFDPYFRNWRWCSRPELVQCFTHKCMLPTCRVHLHIARHVRLVGLVDVSIHFGTLRRRRSGHGPNR